MCTYEKSACSNKSINMNVPCEEKEKYLKRLELFNLLANKVVGYKKRIPEVEVINKDESNAYTTVKYCFVKKIHSRILFFCANAKNNQSNILNENGEIIFSVHIDYGKESIVPLLKSCSAVHPEEKNWNEEINRNHEMKKVCQCTILPLSRRGSATNEKDYIKQNTIGKYEESLHKIHILKDSLNISNVEYMNCMEDSASLRSPLIILLAGASGCGKSTLAALLAYYFQIDNIVSTDHIRSCLRLFSTKNELPFLFPSTYETAELLRENNNCIAAAKCIVDDEYADIIKMYQENCIIHEDTKNENSAAEQCCTNSFFNTSSVEDNFFHNNLSHNNSQKNYCLCVQGYLKQSILLSNVIFDVVSNFANKKESVIVEGVHLTIPLVKRLLTLFPSNCISFIVYLKSAKTHLERFYNRKDETDKYCNYMKCIRCIQRYFCEETRLCDTSLNILTIENLKVSEAACNVVDEVEKFCRKKTCKM